MVFFGARKCIDGPTACQRCDAPSWDGGSWGISAYERRVGVVPACGAGRRKEPVGSRNGSGRRQPQAGIKLVGADPERGTGRPGENLAPRGHDERAGDRGGDAPSQQLAERDREHRETRVAEQRHPHPCRRDLAVGLGVHRHEEGCPGLAVTGGAHLSVPADAPGERRVDIMSCIPL
jgi:hypothetical protein